MKFAAFTLLAFVAFAVANPISVSNNNVGDIITVGLSANAVVSSNIEQNIVTILAALLNQQAIGISAASSVSEQVAETPELQQFNLSPELIEKVKNHISPEIIEKVKSFMN